MSTLQVHITAGPQAGARLQLNQSPVSFGRSPDNTLVLDVPVVSRQHGELQLDESGQWVLVNLSQNGTRVGRKKVTKKPIALTDGAAVTIGDTEVFRVHLPQPESEADTAPPDSETDEAEQPAGTAPGRGMKGRSKLWIGIGAWIGFLALISIYFMTAGRGGGDPVQTSGLYFPGSEIKDQQGPEAGKTAIRRLLAEPLPFKDPKEAEYDKHIAKARTAVNGGKRMLYDAYRHYQQAMSYSDDRDNPLPALDVQRYNERVLYPLSEIIYEQYMRAYRLHDRGSWAEARETLDDLRRQYYHSPEVGDPLAEYIRTLRNAAHQRTGG